MGDEANSTLDFTPFERAVMELLLADDQPLVPDSQEFVDAGLDATVEGQRRALAILRSQFEHAKIASREFSGAGFFTYLTVPASVERITAKRLVLGHIHIESPELKLGAGSVLFVDGGVLNMFETFTYTDEMWTVPRSFSLSYPTWTRTPTGMWISELNDGAG